MKKFTSVFDVTDLHELVQLGLDFKNNPFAQEHLGKYKTLGLLFFNPSLRTRWSTQRAAYNLGMKVISMNAGQGWKIEFEEGKVMNADKAEHIREAAAVISQYCNIIGIRTFPSLTDKEKDYQDYILNQFIRYARVPVISLESAIRHPLQSLADLITISEFRKSQKPKIVLSWAPHPKALPQAVANSFAEWIKHAGYELTITHPAGYELADFFSKGAVIEYNQERALAGADFVYTKNWSSYHDYGSTAGSYEDWMITKEKMQLTNDAKFMHCLPVRRNVVVADGVLNSACSLVIEQANNRTFAAQAVLTKLLKTLNKEEKEEAAMLNLNPENVPPPHI